MIFIDAVIFIELSQLFYERQREHAIGVPDRRFEIGEDLSQVGTLPVRHEPRAFAPAL